jgi:hypothetical protein
MRGPPSKAVDDAVPIAKRRGIIRLTLNQLSCNQPMRRE